MRKIGTQISQRRQIAQIESVFPFIRVYISAIFRQYISRPFHSKGHLMQKSGLQILLPYQRPYYRALAIGTFYALVGAGASAFSPTWLGWAVDALTKSAPPSTLAWYAGGLMLLSGIVALFRYLLRMLTGSIAAGISYRMSQDMFHRLLLFDRETRQRYGTGDLLSPTRPGPRKNANARRSPSAPSPPAACRRTRRPKPKNTFSTRAATWPRACPSGWPSSRPAWS